MPSVTPAGDTERIHVKNDMNTSENTTTRTRGAFGPRRFAVGAASVLAAGALVCAGAQGAMAATSAPVNGSGSVSATASANHDSLDVHGLFSAHGHVNGAKAQALAKRIVADQAVFSLLPSTLQSDLTTLKNASVHQRTADARKIVSSAIAGRYGTAIQSLATHLKDTSHREISRVGDLSDLVKQLTGDASSAATSLGSEAAQVAKAVTGDTQLASKLPASLRTDLSTLASAPASSQNADVQVIAATALQGGYGSQVKQLADQIEQQVVSGH
jgi:hypothetical protein